MGMIDVARLLDQDKVWLNNVPIEELSVGHRTNLVPFLRGNCETLKILSEYLYWNSPLGMEDYASDGVASAKYQIEGSFDFTAEDWLERTKLMQRLVKEIQGQSFVERKAIALRNKAHEVLTGYEKIRYG